VLLHDDGRVTTVVLEHAAKDAARHMESVLR